MASTKVFGGSSKQSRAGGHFDPTRLPAARAFFESEGVIKPGTRPDRNGNTMGDCIAHTSRSHRSCSYSFDGWFYCFGCGVHGDLIDFIKLRYHVDFKTAAKRLGAWSEGVKSVRPKFTRVVRYLVMDFAIDGVQYRAEVIDEPKNDLQVLRRIHADAKDRLHQIRNGDSERIEGEIQWSILANSWALIELELADYVR
jgi:hypothetical protein